MCRCSNWEILIYEYQLFAYIKSSTCLLCLSLMFNISIFSFALRAIQPGELLSQRTAMQGYGEDHWLCFANEVANRYSAQRRFRFFKVTFHLLVFSSTLPLRLRVTIWLRLALFLFVADCHDMTWSRLALDRVKLKPALLKRESWL